MTWLRYIAVGWLWLALGSVGSTYAQATQGLDPHKALSQYQLQGWSTDDGLPQSSINAILQTHEGYLWLGTQEGLVRFDGMGFTPFDKSNSNLGANYITSLVEDQEGTLWVGTRGGGISRLQHGQFSTYTTREGLPSNHVSSLVQTQDGTLWVGTYDAGVSRLTTGTQISFDPVEDLPSEAINTLYEAQTGHLWIGTRGGGAVRLGDGHLVSFDTGDGLTGNDVTALHETDDGTLWVGLREGGLNQIHNGHVIPFALDDRYAGISIQTLYGDVAGALWIGTFRAGVCRYTNAHFSCLNDAEGLAHNSVKALYEGREGSLWIGTDGGGLNRLQDGKFTIYTTHEGLGHDFANTVYEDVEGALWIGTEGGVSRLQEGVFTTFTTADGLSNDFVMSLYGTRDGSVWIGTDDGLNRYQNGVITSYSTRDGLPATAIYALFADADDALWMATSKGLVRYQDDTFTTFTTEDGLTDNIITAIAQGPDGSLWVGTYTRGLMQLLNGKVIATYSHTNGLESDFVLAIHPDADGTVWFSTREGGMNRLRDGHLTTYTTRDGLHNDTVLHILEDKRGHLWMSSSRGLFALSKTQFDQYDVGDRTTLASVVYDRSAGLKSQEFMGGTQPAGWQRADGSLWFPLSGGGIAGIDPARIKRNIQPPLIVLEEAASKDHVLSLTEMTSLPPGEDRVAFRYAGLSLLAPKKVRYRYMLEGADPTWIEAGTRREAFYTNLEPGTYTFRVMARNNDGIWSDEAASVTFRLRPYFYQRPIFYVFSILGFLLLAFLGYNLRVRHLKSREKELVELVEARTHDLREEKEKTEQALHVAQEQKNIAQEARAVIEKQAEQLQEMDRIKTRFFNNISHEFRTPLTLNIGPLENALMGVYGPVDGELRRRLEIMLRNSRLLLRLINQLLDISKLESGRMRLRLHEGDMVALLEGIVLSFTAFAEQKNLTIDFATSEEDVTFYFDADHIEKVFFNLLSNAVKFTPEGERIAVSVAAGTPTPAGEATVEIRVHDNGPGIPAAALPHIFDRFHQVDGTISTVQEGTGIGLTLVKELVELHGGTIQVETEVGHGSTFIVTLPQVTDPGENAILADEAMHLEDSISQGPMVEMAVVADETPTATNGRQAAPASATVLVVDDNPEIRDYVAGCLRGTHQTIMAVDGQDALEKARDIKPDLIVSDVIMPLMTGYDLCRALKADRRLAHIPIILLTSRASLEEKLKGLEAGCDDYLTKPFSARELLMRSQNLLNLSSQKKVLRALNQELRVTNEELREVSEMKSQLLRIAAHDLKNPLNGIREFAKILKEEIESGTPSVELLDLIHVSSDQMLDMVSKILDSEMLESGQLELDMQPVSVARIAESVVRHNRPQAERKGETLLLHLDEDDPCLVVAAPDWLRDALDNLVSNAIKYSPFDKTIWVTVKRHGDVVHFSVRDEGPGLTAQDKQKLFGKFQRLSATPTSDESSTGLGLSIVKQIVELHGGRVWAESEEGHGSTFTIELTAINQRVRTGFGNPVAG